MAHMRVGARREVYVADAQMSECGTSRKGVRKGARLRVGGERERTHGDGYVERVVS